MLRLPGSCLTASAASSTTGTLSSNLAGSCRVRVTRMYIAISPLHEESPRRIVALPSSSSTSGLLPLHQGLGEWCFEWLAEVSASELLDLLLLPALEGAVLRGVRFERTGQVVRFEAENEQSPVWHRLEVPAFASQTDAPVGLGEFCSARAHLLLSPASGLVQLVRPDGEGH